MTGLNTGIGRQSSLHGDVGLCLSLGLQALPPLLPLSWLIPLRLLVITTTAFSLHRPLRPPAPPPTSPSSWELLAGSQPLPFPYTSQETWECGGWDVLGPPPHPTAYLSPLLIAARLNAAFFIRLVPSGPYPEELCSGTPSHFPGVSIEVSIVLLSPCSLDSVYGLERRAFPWDPLAYLCCHSPSDSPFLAL